MYVCKHVCILPCVFVCVPIYLSPFTGCAHLYSREVRASSVPKWACTNQSTRTTTLQWFWVGRGLTVQLCQSHTKTTKTGLHKIHGERQVEWTGWVIDSTVELMNENIEWIDEWKNELMKERMNWWMKARMNELMNQRMNEWIDESKNEWIDEWKPWVNWWVKQWMIDEWKNEWTDEWKQWVSDEWKQWVNWWMRTMSELMNENNQWMMNERMNKLMNKRMNELMNENTEGIDEWKHEWKTALTDYALHPVIPPFARFIYRFVCLGMAWTAMCYGLWLDLILQGQST